MRERLEEVEEQEASYQRQLADIYAQLDMVRQEGVKGHHDHNTRIESFVKNIKADISRDMDCFK